MGAEVLEFAAVVALPFLDGVGKIHAHKVRSWALQAPRLRRRWGRGRLCGRRRRSARACGCGRPGGWRVRAATVHARRVCVAGRAASSRRRRSSRWLTTPPSATRWRRTPLRTRRAWLRRRTRPHSRRACPAALVRRDASPAHCFRHPGAVAALTTRPETSLCCQSGLLTAHMPVPVGRRRAGEK
eukprot:scaffold2578_cov370-Prasinococcus_capsulatus_cf.AAC.2